MFKKQLNEGQAGDNVGLLIRGIKRDDVERGQVRLRVWLAGWLLGWLAGCGVGVWAAASSSAASTAPIVEHVQVGVCTRGGALSM